MGKSYTKIWMHCVWSTKNRARLIHPTFERELYDFIREELRKMNCFVLIVNGMPDHVHCLFFLNPQKTTTDVVKQIKGSSSYYINSKNYLPVKFIWQRGFGAFSVSESGKDRVFEYIKNQKKHHNKQSFDDEYIQFGQFHGFDNMELD